MSGRSKPDLKTSLPILPKPLIPTRTAIHTPPLNRLEFRDE
jgi:hypothetical protein